MADCAAFDPAGPFVGGVLALVDCHALGLAGDGWRALGGGAWLRAALTIAVALTGYRLLLGQVRGRDGVMLGLRMGVVLALVTQWPAWEAVAYRVGMEGPESLAVSVLGAGARRDGLAARYDRIGRGLDEALRVDEAQTAEDKVQPGGRVLSSEARGQLARAGGWMAATALAGMMAPRLMIALLLGLGPLFAGALLLAGAQGLFVGWLRACIGAVLASVGGAMVLGLELAVAEPLVARLLDGLGGVEGNALAGRIMTGAGLFATVLVAVSLGVMRAAWAIRMPEPGRAMFTMMRGTSERELTEHLATERRSEQTSATRVQHFAQSAMRSLRREEMMTQRTDEKAGAPVPLGQSGGAAARRALRPSGAAQRRDGAA